jgi:hypothetical protein
LPDLYIAFALRLAARLALIPAIALTPFMLVRMIAPSLARAPLVAVAGATSLLLNASVPLLLHLLRVPIHAPSLAAVHWGLFLILFAVAALIPALKRRVLCRRQAGEEGSSFLMDRMPWIPAFLFAALILPVTHLAGIDTYKWQDLATAVRVEQCIPWLVHPLSLFGFTPRSYPSIQPLTMASIQILGGLGVDGGYYIVSLLSGLTGLFAALWLGTVLFPSHVPAMLFGVFYAFSPVFLRYNHWATGRGVFVALLPLFLIACLRLPRLAALLALPALAAMLCLAHKAGLVAVPLILAALPFGLLLPRRDIRWLRILLVVPFAVAAGLLAGTSLTSSVVGLATRSITRFGWYIPAAALAILAVREWWSRPAWRLLFFPALLTVPLAFHKEMYGALLTLPFVCHAATAAASSAMERWPLHRAALLRAALALTVAGALAIIAHRTWTATPRDVWRAAMFLEQYDPLGPFRIDAPDGPRTQVQAYCSGCPRFTVRPASARAPVALRPAPALRWPLRTDAQVWIDYLRHAFAAGEAEVEWYGDCPRSYWLVIHGDGLRPGGRLLYRDGELDLYAPASQAAPVRPSAQAATWRRP